MDKNNEPKGHRATIILEWDYSLGPAWINTDNLENLLFTSMETNRDFLRVIEFEPPPIIKPEPKIDSRELAYKFLLLPVYIRNRIIKKLKVIQDNMDETVPELERARLAFAEVKKQGIIKELYEEVMKEYPED